MLLQAAAPRVADVIDLVVFSNAFVVANGQSKFRKSAGYTKALLKLVTAIHCRFAHSGTSPVDASFAALGRNVAGDRDDRFMARCAL
jgi:hypothetical protein